MAKTKFNKSKKYLTAEEFIEHCKANNVETSLDALEAYEKVGLLFPIYRLVVPDNYICALFKYNHRSTFDPNASFDVENKWREITDLVNALSSCSFPPSPHFKGALKNGHPLDHAYRNKNPFLYKPSLADYRPWGKYIIVAGIIEGHPEKKEIVDHYYAPWQIFVMEELNLMHTIEENYAIDQKKGWGIFKKDIHPTKLFGFFESFQTISNFRMLESLIWHDITFGLKQSIIEGKLVEQLRARTIEAARQEYGKHSHASWIEFIRKLVELYNDYLEKEKIRLSNELKSYLTSTLNMIIDATQKPFEASSNDYDGRFKGHRQRCREKDTFIYPGELERIYPDEVKQAKERARRSFESQIKQFNETCPDNLKIAETIIDALIDNIVESGHMLLLSHIYEIEKLWFDRQPHWESSIWAHLRSFTISIESIGHEWFKQNSFGKILEYAFKKEYIKLRDSIDGGIIGAKTPAKYKQKIAKISERKKDGICGICGYHLVSTYLTRNYFSHKIKFEPDMLGSLFIEVYKDLLFTLVSLFVKKGEFDKLLARKT